MKISFFWNAKIEKMHTYREAVTPFSNFFQIETHLCHNTLGKKKEENELKKNAFSKTMIFFVGIKCNVVNNQLLRQGNSCFFFNTCSFIVTDAKKTFIFFYQIQIFRIFWIWSNSLFQFWTVVQTQKLRVSKSPKNRKWTFSLFVMFFACKNTQNNKNVEKKNLKKTTKKYDTLANA